MSADEIKEEIAMRRSDEPLWHAYTRVGLILLARQYRDELISLKKRQPRRKKGER